MAILTINIGQRYGNTLASGTFTKNDCTSGGTGSTVIYTVPANTFHSIVSQSDADSQATNDVDTNKQSYANTNGQCIAISTINYNTTQQADPYVDLELQGKRDGTIIFQEDISGSGSVTAIGGVSFTIETYTEAPSTADSPMLRMQVFKNSILIYDETIAANPDGPSLVYSGILSTSSVDVYDVISTSTGDIPAETTPCGTASEYTGGATFPTDIVVNIGSSLGTVELDFNAFDIPDKFQVYFNGVKVIDTGYRGDSAYQSALDTELTNRGLPTETIAGVGAGLVTFNKTSAATTALVRIYAPLDGTAWSWTLQCPV